MTNWTAIQGSEAWEEFWNSEEIRQMESKLIFRILNGDDSNEVRRVEGLRGELRMLQKLRELPAAAIREIQAANEAAARAEAQALNPNQPRRFWEKVRDHLQTFH